MTQRKSKETNGAPSHGVSLQEILEMGFQASQLMGNPVFAQVLSTELHDLATQILDSDPHEEKKRESLYRDARAWKNLSVRMNSLIQEAAIAQSALDEQNNPETQRNEFLDMQGFSTGN